MKKLLLISCCLLMSLKLGFTTQKALIELNGETYLGIVGSFNQPISSSESGTFGTIVFPDESNRLGCSEWSDNDKSKLLSITNINSETSQDNYNHNHNHIAIAAIYRGECTFVEKTLYAQTAGASIALIIDENDNLVPMGNDDESFAKFNIKSTDDVIPSLMVGNTLFSATISTLSTNTNTDNNKQEIIEQQDRGIIINIKEYNKMIFDNTMIVMIFISTFLVGLGAYYSSDIERSRYYGGSIRSFRIQQESQEIDTSMAWSFVVVASLGLLTLFYFIQYIFYFIVVIFVIGSTNGLTSIGSHIVEMFKPNFDNVVFKQFDVILTKSEIIALVPSLGISVTWFFYRSEENAWMLQDLMCVGLLMVLQRTIRMNNLKIATILLNMAFFYDIFWVFLSPYFFTKSVMVEVATYSHTNSRDTLPVVLKFPRLNDPFHSPMILGLGDIALPGLLISYLLRFDYQSKIKSFKNSYFIMSLIGYFIGMALTDINLILMEHGQPALLFLVPCTLWIVSWRAWKKGEFWRLWHGINGKTSIINGHGDRDPNKKASKVAKESDSD